MGPFIMNPEGVARFFARDEMNEGPFPEHYEPFENSARLQPAASAEPAGDQQSGGARVPGRPGRVRQGGGFPAYGDHVSSDRALPLLDQACASEFDHSAAAVRRDWRGPGEGSGRGGGRPREGVVQSRLHHCGGGGDQAHQAVDDRRQEGADGRHSAALGLQGADETGLSRQYADARPWATGIRRHRNSSRSW